MRAGAFVSHRGSPASPRAVSAAAVPGQRPAELEKAEEEWPEIKESGGKNASEAKVGKNCQMKWALAESETTNRSSIYFKG